MIQGHNYGKNRSELGLGVAEQRKVRIMHTVRLRADTLDSGHMAYSEVGWGWDR